MPSFFKPMALGLGLVACIAIGAQAQTVSTVPTPGGANLANLPPEGPRVSSMTSIPATPRVDVTKSSNYPGPDVGKGWYSASERPTQAVQPSPQYVGPRPN